MRRSAWKELLRASEPDQRLRPHGEERASSATSPGRMPWRSCGWPTPRRSGRSAASTACRTSRPRPATSSRSRSPCRASRFADPPGARLQEPADLEPTAFDINTSIQRCLVKAIALHGLGLYVYAGEDLPDGEKASRRRNRTPRSPRSGPSGPSRSAQQRYIERLIARDRERPRQAPARLLRRFDPGGTADGTNASRAMKALQQAKRRAA